ncbi:hypothetical protein TYRP_023372 [Tyrophagus putrescentiae]|nr:hypothetical protein TYRP_023372 [Tyrophagus putrescentiae]
MGSVNRCYATHNSVLGKTPHKDMSQRGPGTALKLERNMDGGRYLRSVSNTAPKLGRREKTE